MSPKKYLSLEEAADLLKIKPDELIRLREKGDVRGFADRGTWKFKSEDVEELKRRRQPDSAPEVPMMSDDDDLSRQPTIITKGRSGAASDSDVRLVPDDKMRAKLTGSSAEIPTLGDSDSDVRLAGAVTRELPSDSDVQLVTPRTADSDSDVKIADTDSDVRLSDSDSDVRLAPPSPSDSDVKLVERGRKKRSSDSDVTLLPRGGQKAREESPLFDDSPLSGSESVLMEDVGLGLTDSDIRLGSGIAGDSGIALSSPADSGILLEGPAPSGSDFPLLGGTLSESSENELVIEEDSGISIESDSGIQLSGDSGIRLEAESGIRLSGPSSGVKKGTPRDELDSAVPMLLSKDDAARTDVEVPMIDEGSEFETLNLPPKKKKGKGDTSVVVFEEDDSGMGLDGSSDDLAIDELGSSSVDEELEVAEDILEDEDAEQMEVFDSDDSVFDESFVEGGSSVAIPAYGSRIQMMPEVEWGTGTIALLAATAVALSIGALAAVDLLRTTWASGSSSVYQGELLGMLTGLFK